jgi:hypothetical protein
MKPIRLSRRLRITLSDAARSYQGRMSGTHVLNNGMAAYKLERHGLVRIEHPFAFATEAGLAWLRNNP